MSFPCSAQPTALVGVVGALVALVGGPVAVALVGGPLAPNSRPPTQDRPTDRRTYEERNLEELRERARELDIEGRSAMSKDELIAALRQQAK